MERTSPRNAAITHSRTPSTIPPTRSAPFILFFFFAAEIDSVGVDSTSSDTSEANVRFSWSSFASACARRIRYSFSVRTITRHREDDTYLFTPLLQFISSKREIRFYVAQHSHQQSSRTLPLPFLLPSSFSFDSAQFGPEQLPCNGNDS